MNSRSPTFVSIASHSYSGSTLLAILLTAHPKIATVGEMNGPNPTRVDTDRYRCSCNQLIRQCQFWRAIKHNMHDKGFEFDVTDFETRFIPSRRSLKDRLQWGSLGSNALESLRDSAARIWAGHSDQLKRMVARNEAFVKAVLEVTGKQAFVDTSKNPWRFRYLSQFSTLDVRVVHLVRDVKGSVASQLRRSRGRSADQAARSWIRENTGISRLLKLLPEDRQMIFRYEDLCRNPETALGDLCRFLGVDPSVDLSDPQSVPEHHIIGNTIRLHNISQIKLDERWKEELTQEQLNVIDQIAGHMSTRYGFQ